MKDIDILPLEGIEIDNFGKILFGMSTSEVKQLLGQPSESSNLEQLCFDEYEVRIDLDKNQNVAFIEFIYGPFPQKTKLSIYGIDPFKIGANRLLEILTEKNNGIIDDSEADHCFTFVNISVGVWRQFSEKDIEESIAAMTADNEYEQNKDWLQEDKVKAQNFWTIGVGIKNYYA